MDFVKILFFGLVALAGLFYLYCIYTAIRCTLKGNPTAMPGYLDHSITTITGVLTTNFGAVLGIKIPERANLVSLRMGPTSPPIPSALQMIAAYLFVLCLLAAFITWLMKNFTNDPSKIVPAVPRLSKILIGVALGAFAVALGVTIT
jgi:hypothetical protein